MSTHQATAPSAVGSAARIDPRGPQFAAALTSVVLAAFHSPDVLLLDEPFDGVDPLGVEATMELVAEARLAGAAVLISTHLLDLAVQACGEAVVLRHGRVVGASPSSELSGEEGAARYRGLLS